MEDEIFNSAELMDFLKIKSSTTLIDYEKKGLIIPHRPFGKKKYYLKSEVMTLFKRDKRV